MGESNPLTGPESGTVKTPREAGMVFILITLFIDILGIGIIIPVLPELVKEFVGGDTAHAGLYVGIIAGAYSLTQFAFAPVMGALSDRYGRRPVILASLFGLGVDFAIQGFAPSIGWLFVGRIFAGAMGASFTTANAYIADVSTPETRARNFGLVGVMFGLGFIFGPALGGVLGEWNLRLPFFVAAGLALLNWVYGYFILPESLREEDRSPISLSKMHPLGSISRLNAYPVVGALTVTFICASLAQRGLENVWVLYMGHRFEWDSKQNGIALGLVGLMALFVQGGLVRPMVARFGERKCALIGLAASATAFLGYGLVTEEWMVYVIIVIGSLGGLWGPAIKSLVTGAVSPSEQGVIQGAMTSLISLTNIVAPLVFTTGLFSYFTSDKAPFEFAGAPFILGSVLFVCAFTIASRAFRRIPEKPDENDESRTQAADRME